MKLIDFINMVIKENFRPRKIKVYGFKYNLINKNLSFDMSKYVYIDEITFWFWLFK